MFDKEIHKINKNSSMYTRSIFLYLVSASILVTPVFLLPVTVDSMSLKALAQTQTDQDREVEADRLYQQGIELLRKRQLQQAVEKFQEALVIYQEINVYRAERMRYLIGGIYEQLGESDRAQKYYLPTSESFGEVSSNIPEEERLTNEELVPIAREIKKQADQLYQQGIQQLRQDQLQQALQTFQQVLPIYQELKFREILKVRLESRDDKTGDEKKVLYQIASIYEQLGESKNAENNIKEAELRVTLYSASGQQDYDFFRDDDEDPKTRANRLFKEGSLWLENRNLEGARIAFEKVLGIRKKLGDRQGQTETLLVLAKVHEQMGNKNWAEQLSRRAREIGLR